MRDRKIVISPFELIDLVDCTIYKEVNEHSTAFFKGRISADKEEEYVEMSLKNLYATITAMDEDGGEKIVFNGLVKDLAVTTENGVRLLSVWLVSGTFLMDSIRHIRTYQKKTMLFKEVLEAFTSEYPENGFIMTVAKGTPIDEMIVQYQETDWEFLKRLASRFNSFVVPDYKVGGVHYFFGMPKRSEPVVMKPIIYSMKKRVDEYIYKTDNKVEGFKEKDAIYYLCKDREIYDLGDILLFKGQTLYVWRIETKYDGNEFVHTYYLKDEAGFKVEQTYNERMIGASLLSTITAIENDVVWVDAALNELKDKTTDTWHPYSTVYTSPDGTGWYYMPEIGDTVRLHFPSNKETDAFVISAVDIDQPDQLDRTIPDHKSLKTVYLKQLLFTPSTILLTNNHKEETFIKIDDNGGIQMESPNNITIRSDSDVIIETVAESSKMNVVAGESVTMEQGPAKIMMKNDITFEGAKMDLE